MTIGVLARQAGVNIETIRYYQRIGLLEQPPTPASGYRIYPPAAVDRIHFIQRAKQLGFSLAEIGQMIELDAGHCQQTRQLAEHKLELIQQKIHDLQAMATTLQGHIDACHNNHDRQTCPLITALLAEKNPRTAP